MKALWIIFLAILALSPLCADFANDLGKAAKPLDDGVPEVAVVHLRGLLAKTLLDPEWCTAAEKLAEALIAAHQPAEALSLLDDARAAGIPFAKFWRAQALADLQRPAEALPLYQQIAADRSSPFFARATFGAGEMLRALRRPADARQQFATLIRDRQWGIRARLRLSELMIDSGEIENARRILEETRPQSVAEQREHQLLRGRLSISHHPERGIDTFRTVLEKSDGASHDVQVATLFALADAHLNQKTPELGDDVLENYIEHHPHDADLARIFAKLDELYRAEQDPSASELERWVRDVEQPRRSLAQWFLARIELRAGHRERAAQLFSDLRRSHMKSPALAEGYLEFAGLEMEQRHFDDALSILAEAKLLRPERAIRDQIDVLMAEALYRVKRFQDAATAFELVANESGPLAKESKFNSAMAWLKTNNSVRFLASADNLEKQPGGEQTRAQLRLETALAQAGKHEKAAEDSLRSFVRDFPHDQRVSEAWVALAEISFHNAPPRLDEARKDLIKATESNPTAAANERADYLMIWIEDSTKGNDTKVIDLAKGFLDRHPRSARADDVRLKLAETYYRRQDFPNAQTEFERLLEQNPSGQLSEKALFFAAESAMSSMGPNALDHAITLFDRVVRLNGELKWTARNEQAAIERKLGKPQDALVLYEEVLKNDVRLDEKEEALCGKGDILSEMAGTEPANYRRAIEVYDQLAATAGDEVQWRNQALFKKGVCLEKQADKTNALATFYAVLENETQPDRPHEVFWFYKAGFNAARLLEDDSKWKSAAAIYEKLAAAGGVRSEEAKARLNRLRLEHFLWEE